MISAWFFGTPEPAAKILARLFASANFKVLAVVTPPDKKIGRRHKLAPSPVKTAALARGLMLLQPEKLNNYAASANIERPDIFIVYQYGLIIPKAMLSWPKQGAINIHPSFLPKYRGATPIQEALIQGNDAIGVSLMLMDEKMDHGPILAQSSLTVAKDELYESVMERATAAAAELIEPTILDFCAGKTTPQPQNDAAATSCELLSKDKGRINWQDPALKIYNQYRAYHAWPGIFTMWKEKRLKLLEISGHAANQENAVLLPGQIKLNKEILIIGTGVGYIAVNKLQLEGGKPMRPQEFLAGHGELARATLT